MMINHSGSPLCQAAEGSFGKTNGSRGLWTTRLPTTTLVV